MSDSNLKSKIEPIKEVDEEQETTYQFSPNTKLHEEDREENQESDSELPPVKETKNFVVGSITGMDIGEIFGFEKNQKNRQTFAKRLTRMLGENSDYKEDDEAKLYEKFPKYLAWFVLFYSVFNGACMPPWIMSIPADKYLRICWRFILQAAMMVPFILYEHRTGNDKVRQAYDIKFILKYENLRKIYLASLSTTLTFLSLLFCFDYAYISQVFLLGGMQNFWLSFNRWYNSENNHEIESGGLSMCGIGLILIMLDSYLIDLEDVPAHGFTDINPKLYFREPWMRVVIGNIFPFITALILSKISKYTVDLRQVFPPYLSTFIISIFVSLNMCLVSYFVDGTTVDGDSKFGWFGLFRDSKFILFMYMSMMLSLGVFLTSILISKLFEPIVPATALLFEPIVTSILIRISHVQDLPGSLSVFGYCFILPGQHMLKKDQETKAAAHISHVHSQHASDRVMELKVLEKKGKDSDKRKDSVHK